MSDSDSDLDDIVMASASIILLTLIRRRILRRRRARQLRANHYLRFQQQIKARFVVEFSSLRAVEDMFKKNFNMVPTEFDELLELLEPALREKQAIGHNDGISPKEKIAIVFEYLTNGSLQGRIASKYNAINKQQLGNIIIEVCSLVCENVESAEVNPDTFIYASEEFQSKCDFPNCIGAVGCKQLYAKCPQTGLHKISVLAAVDTDYKFMYLDVGQYGNGKDSNIFIDSHLGKHILEDKLPILDDFPVGDVILPHVFIANQSFPLNKRVMTPYVPKDSSPLTDEEQIFNYNLARVERYVENAFGILCSHWHCLRRTMFCEPKKAQKIITSCVLLHNFLIEKENSSYCPPKFADEYDANGILIEGAWRRNLPSNTFQTSSLEMYPEQSNTDAENIRDCLKKFMTSTVFSEK